MLNSDNPEKTDLVDFKWHSLQYEKVMQLLQTGEEGLSEEEAKKRLEEYGPNELREEKRVTPLSIFLGQFKSILIIILILSAAVSGYVDIYIDNEAPIDMYIIAIIVVMNSIIGFIQEYRAEKAIEALKRMVAPMAGVIRSGNRKIIPTRELVLGDIILLEAGDKVPTDSRIIEAVSLNVDEAALTGESVAVTKNAQVLPKEASLADRKNLVFMGTDVAYGRAKAVTIATGMSTEFGKIAESLQTIKIEEPPLKKKIEHMGRQLGAISLVLTILTVAIGVMGGTAFIEMFMLGVSMAVSAIPEGLPAVITVTLAWGVSRMARERAIVRRLASVETLGSTTVICSDKTGTLTRNEMTVSRFFVNGEMVDVTGSGYDPQGDFLKDGVKQTDLDDTTRLLLEIGALCNNASLNEEMGRWQIIGDPTEGALIVLAEKAGIRPKDYEEKWPRVAEAPFSSERKRMSTIHLTPENKVTYVKGAPETILDLSVSIRENNRIRSLTEEDRKRILKKTQSMASEGLRLLAMAYKEIPDEKEDLTSTSHIESNLIFVGLTGMIDPPRKEVPEAIKLCLQAGIRSIMITGDHRLTAVSVAKQIGLLKENHNSRTLTGNELDELNDEELTEIIDEVSVYARVSPEHKLRIAQALKRQGHVVAMTGDGVNDAPAIKAADIGIAMGIKGTDVTKEAADMVLEDDNFATIVKAVEGGRHIFDNIKKYLRLMISANFDEFLELTIMALLGLPFTLLPIHILWVNLVSDGLPAVALSMDPKDPDIMKRKPIDRRVGFLRPMWRFVFFVALLDLVTNLIPFIVILTDQFTVWGLWEPGQENHLLLLRARGMNFTSLVFFEILLAFVCRSENHSLLGMGWKSFIANKLLLYSAIGSWILQLAILYVPFLNSVFGVAPLSPLQLAISISLSLVVLIVHPGKLLHKKIDIEDYASLIGFFVSTLMMIIGVYLHSFGRIFWIGVVLFCLSIFIMYDGDRWLYHLIRPRKKEDL